MLVSLRLSFIIVLRSICSYTEHREWQCVPFGPNFSDSYSSSVFGGVYRHIKCIIFDCGYFQMHFFQRIGAQSRLSALHEGSAKVHLLGKSITFIDSFCAWVNHIITCFILSDNAKQVNGFVSSETIKKPFTYLRTSRADASKVFAVRLAVVPLKYIESKFLSKTKSVTVSPTLNHLFVFACAFSSHLLAWLYVNISENCLRRLRSGMQLSKAYKYSSLFLIRNGLS